MLLSEEAEMGVAIEIGQGITLEQTECSHGRYGFMLKHPRPDLAPEFDGLCEHLVPTCTNHGPTFWTVDQEEPLTLSPSLLLVDEGLHGFVRAGQWVPA